MTLLNETQKERLLEISRYLRQTREEKSIRIEEVAAQTNIRLSLLKALDAGDFEELPEPVYVQGFIRRYADIVGLDGTAVANSFTVNALPPNPYTDSKQKKANSDKKPKIRIPLVVPYILLLGIAGTGLIYVLNPKLITKSLTNKKASVSSQVEQTTPSQVVSSSTEEGLANQQNSIPQETSPVATPSSVTAESSTLPNSTDNSNLTVTLELQGDSWLQVTADGKTEFVGNLTKGERRTWAAQKELTVRSGNAGAVLVGVDNQPAQPLGGQGEVKQVTYKSENIGQ
ncbi:helix-turn-helix domain-containing protein [Nostoc sp. UHCC 0870]|uniref:helix-turn-helix domain-containing protein n=1 Tax=Nostoc sp. UHCC 0870 TaxID=2914041 RepID=UPI001EDDB3FF|nr:RodZ family helix-turn-helix domain-containing protein [Nostoc sp. UHCC 0870]UKP00146.1 helix-turn-helix domain-containing protein [Nostoc sp. UHCC 0870]